MLTGLVLGKIVGVLSSLAFSGSVLALLWFVFGNGELKR